MTEPKRIPLTLLFGSLAGLGMILVTIVNYKSGTHAFVGSRVYLMYPIPVLLAPIAALIERNRNGGYLGFRPALRICFGIIVLALALQVVFTWILVHWIDPGFGQAVRPVMEEKMVANYRRFGAPEDEISKAMAAQKDSDPFGLGSMLSGLPIFYIAGFLIALLLAALVRRKNPAEA